MPSAPGTGSERGVLEPGVMSRTSWVETGKVIKAELTSAARKHEDAEVHVGLPEWQVVCKDWVVRDVGGR